MPLPSNFHAFNEFDHIGGIEFMKLTLPVIGHILEQVDACLLIFGRHVDACQQKGVESQIARIGFSGDHGSQFVDAIEDLLDPWSGVSGHVIQAVA